MNAPLSGAPGDGRARILETLRMRERVAAQVGALFKMPSVPFRQWQQDALRAAVAHAADASPFYRAHLAGSAPAFLDSGRIADFTSLPFTTRQHLNDAYPFGMLAVGKDELVRFGESSGTSSGTSIAAFFTAEDWFTNNCTVAQMLQQVLTPQDVVAVAVPYELAGVGQDLDRALELAGCIVIALGAAPQFCPPERMVRILRDAGVTALICSGTRALHLSEVAQQLGIDPRRDLKVSKLLCAGEGSSPAKQAILRETWGADTFAMFGMTETNTLGMFCGANQLHLIENRSYFELIDPDSGAPAAPGAAGELVVTTLCSRALPLVRYRTGDLVQIEDQPCACGSPFHTMRHLGRVADHLLVQGRSMSMLALEQDVLSELACAPYHFGVKVVDGQLHIGLTENNYAEEVRARVAARFAAQHGLAVSFLLMDKEKVDQAVRNAVKPTMKSIYLN
ncbi:phenylacetate--CoA ligase family protein [Massilia sp. BJB1822]|uniref:phenylacetate--CoA ligase family protein n=1 Tax=Massilia sp. BJB1822 TaxID=2744470 RepID=UPI00159424CD|nr:phenylacetate--CoA ligase family protein [Massilia sp. BJB1822]NVD98800.1 phenylacetate--CoA ligase family protein [Massilia sp. BJB1822]